MASMLRACNPPVDVSGPTSRLSHQRERDRPIKSSLVSSMEDDSDLRGTSTHGKTAILPMHVE
jgi:hypothetical protein